MSARGRQELPKVLLALPLAFEGQEVPEAVLMFMQAVAMAFHVGSCPGNNPTIVLNRSIGQLRKQHPGAIMELAQWLAEADVMQYAVKAGAGWAWREWCVAADRLLAGEKASVAFGADKPGRPAGLGFTIYEDAALLAEHMTRNEGRSSSDAERECLELRGNLDARGVQRQRAKLRAMKIPDNNLYKQARLIRRKYAPKPKPKQS